MLQINIGNIVKTTQSEGPGQRYAIWVKGCFLDCEACCNPHLQSFEGGTLMTTGEIFHDIMSVSDIEGITIIGGEPFEQAAPLAELCRKVSNENLGVMVFSGFTKSYIEKQNADWLAFLAEIDLLVDGPYIDKLHCKKRRWVGSSNQVIHHLSERYEHLKNRWPKGKNSVDIFFDGKQLSINGFPIPELTKELKL